ncbi:hypothetical protein BABINDRAFT_168103 [Babjeviella inositovora NRRL Y-12698]|uniref:BHLH domain-containing protein n=1 Tax=Babjeviella inositovora NRRL Y-12698 TaxID=984486 RepID=A0A1E3QMN0_9ASCO|nr:uncharacterized protein BABINDRAFT_168103 [Babjeviella inositovora NRRL Y-12698]ODQ78935.1 hypothetical protein BABINDRAFT_168103 [Babjeviella inositovora NRRL Y-12698]
MVPPPPKFKPTIIQMKTSFSPVISNTNSVFSNDYELSLLFPVDYAPPALPKPSPLMGPKGYASSPLLYPLDEAPAVKRRRRSSNSISPTELAKRKQENKTAHSIIEKKRRIKMNREFEALKFLIPACREANLLQSPPMGASIASSAASSSNNGKIDGMHKLTILQASVEYILYLHRIIELQNTELATQAPSANKWELFDIGFTQFGLNINEYRNIEQDFDFHQAMNPPPSRKQPSQVDPLKEKDIVRDPSLKYIRKRSASSISFSGSYSGLGADLQLPSPVITPQMTPYRNSTSFVKPVAPLKPLSLSPKLDPKLVVVRSLSLPGTPLANAQTPPVHLFTLPDSALESSFIISLSVLDTTEKGKSHTGIVPARNGCISEGGSPMMKAVKGSDEVNGAEVDGAEVLMMLRRTSNISSLLN